MELCGAQFQTDILLLREIKGRSTDTLSDL